MNVNLVADTLNSALQGLHARVTRNTPPTNPTSPHVVFNVESVTDTYPSNDFYIYVDVIDNPNVSVRAIETLADTIDVALNHQTFDTTQINIHFERILRQYVGKNDLTSLQMIQLQYSARAYFK